MYSMGHAKVIHVHTDQHLCGINHASLHSHADLWLYSMDHAKVIHIHAYPRLYGVDHTRLPTATDEKGHHICNVGHAK